MMTSLLSRICYTKAEDTTTEILAYLLHNFTPCRSVFLPLVGITTEHDHCIVSTQNGIPSGRPDLMLQDQEGQWIVLIENKPWEFSSFTGPESDQLKRYAEYLKTIDAPQKILCLLATESNKKQLLQSAASLEGVVADECLVKKHYAKNQINFIVITWEQVFEIFDVANEERDSVSNFLVMELKKFLFQVKKIPLEVMQDIENCQENFKELKALTTAAKNLLLQRTGYYCFKTSTYRDRFYIHRIEGPKWGVFSFGPSPNEWERISTHGHLPRHPFFLLLTKEYEEKTDFETLTKDFLEKRCGFICHTEKCSFDKDWWVYIKPLEFEDGEITPQKIADATMKITNQINEEYDKVIAS